jgi:hypothetical protein
MPKPAAAPMAVHMGAILEWKTMGNENPSLTTEQAQAVVAAKTAPKVTKEGIEARINSVSYVHHDHLTICIIQMVNDFRVIGKAAPASPENFDPEVGKRYAYDDAFKQLWPLEGYVLCETLYQQSLPVATEEAKC